MSKKAAQEDFKIALFTVFFISLLGIFLIIIADISTGENRFNDTSLNLDFTWWNETLSRNWMIFVILFVILIAEPFMRWITIITGNKRKWEKLKDRVVRANELDKKGDANPASKNFIERWTVRHFIISGIIAFFIPGFTLPFFIGSLMFETVERITSHSGRIYNYRGEPISNQIVDIIANVLGYLTGTYLSGLIGDPISLI